MSERPQVGVGVIVVRDGKVLLGKRKSAHGEGTWSFPGGHLEFGESTEECAKREVFEETGLHISNVHQSTFTNDIFEVESKHYVTLFMIAQSTCGTPEVREPKKCEKWEWHSWDHLPTPLFLPIENLLKGGFDQSKVIQGQPRLAPAGESAAPQRGDQISRREN